jgi:hypothetical protein
MASRKSINIEDRRHLKTYHFMQGGKPRSISVDPTKKYGPKTQENILRSVLQDRAAVERYRRVATIVTGQGFSEFAARRKMRGGRAYDPTTMPYIPRLGTNSPMGRKPFTPLTDVGMRTKFTKR